ncbi:MAG: hypothetical protein WKF51_07375, partial [Geodermatophilaceae bacterium]
MEGRLRPLLILVVIRLLLGLGRVVVRLRLGLRRGVVVRLLLRGRLLRRVVLELLLRLGARPGARCATGVDRLRLVLGLGGLVFDAG